MCNLRDTVFYSKTNVLQDFYICISVPLNLSIERAQGMKGKNINQSVFCLTYQTFMKANI